MANVIILAVVTLWSAMRATTFALAFLRGDKYYTRRLVDVQDERPVWELVPHEVTKRWELVIGDYHTIGSAVVIDNLRQRLTSDSGFPIGSCVFDAAFAPISETWRKSLMQQPCDWQPRLLDEYPLMPEDTADFLGGMTYRCSAQGGFIPVVPQGWRAIRMTSAWTSWLIVPEDDPRVGLPFDCSFYAFATGEETGMADSDDVPSGA